MPVTKQTARKGLSNPFGGTGQASGINEYGNEYDSFTKDIIGEENNSDSDDGYDEKKNKGRGRRVEEEESEATYMFFDFRKGEKSWPENVEVVDQKRADSLLEKATLAAEEAAKNKKIDAEEGGKKDGGSSTSYSISWDSKGGSSSSSAGADDESLHSAHAGAVFETLKDGSTAFILKPGYRLKLHLNDLLEGGDAKKEERAKNKEKEKKRKEKYSSSYSGAAFGMDFDVWGDSNFTSGSGGKSKWFKQYVNEYTITMDIKLLEEPPRDGMALFQTALIHAKENKRSGKSTVTRSDGECIINQAGGVGMFGTFGDTTKARLQTGMWHRVVVAVKCSTNASEKGELRTWVNTESGVVLKEETIAADERFAIDPDSLFLFSAATGAMMPGNVAIRTVRVEKSFATDQTVKQNRARDKLLSRFNEERQAELAEQRKGLSLASLFAKPRPMWAAPAFVATFGDAFVQNSTLEGNSNLAWSYTVLNLALQRLSKQESLLLHEDIGLTHSALTGLSDTLHVMQQSAAVFKLMLRMLKTPTESQLLSFMRKLKKILNAVSVGESLLLPLYVEGKELSMIIERTNDRLFRVVVVQTDASRGLNFHSSNATQSLPCIDYRTCLVMNDVPKKHVLDDVFWVAIYSMAIQGQEGDMTRLYDVMLPFLTGKPLEVSLVEAEMAALLHAERMEEEKKSKHSAGVIASIDEDDDEDDDVYDGGGATESKANDSVAEKAEPTAEKASAASVSSTVGSSSGSSSSLLTKHTVTVKDFGSWRSPQRSNTAYVRCVLEAMYFIMRSKGVSELDARKVHLCLCVELMLMAKNDLTCVLPDQNGVSVMELASRELCRLAVDLADSFEADTENSSSVDKATTQTLILNTVHKMVEEIDKTLVVCKEVDGSVPSFLDLSGVKPMTDDESAEMASAAEEATSAAAAVSIESPAVTTAAGESKSSDGLCEGDNCPLPASTGAGTSTGVAAAAVSAPPREESTKVTVSMDDPNLTQFMNTVAWETSPADPDPGQIVSLSKYVPVDLLQIPERVSTREQAVTAMRMCDRLCTLLDNQSHCIKNNKFLIVAAIEHVFTQVVPIPKPRGVGLTEAELKTSQRTEKRREKKDSELKLKADEKKKRLVEKGRSKGASKAAKKAAAAAVAAEKDAKDEDDADGDALEDEDKEGTAASGAGEKGLKKKKKQFFGNTLVEADAAPGKEAQQEATDAACIWAEPMTYELQVEILLELQRLSEFFASSAMSLQQSRPFDAVIIVVSGCISAVADAVIRKVAIDDPSLACSHLCGKTLSGRQLGHAGFGISVGSFATQSETVEVYSPELVVARTAVLDYFQSPQQRRMDKIFSWEENFLLKPNKPLIKYLRMVCREMALPAPRPCDLLLDTDYNTRTVMKSFPELKCFRDIVFWWKYFLNTDRKTFPNYVNPTSAGDVPIFNRPRADLAFQWNGEHNCYQVACSWNDNMHCRPDPKQVDPATGKFIPLDQLPTHRYPSTATPSFYVAAPLIRTEDDVIYRPTLPSFADLHGQVLNQRDSELLISYLTVPYMRIPLLVTFFSTEDRIHKLQSPELRLILDSVLFEPGAYQRVDMCGVAPTMVPTPVPEMLSTPFGLLMNELARSPSTVVGSILTLLRGALACDTGSVVDKDAQTFNNSATIILYVIRLAARVENYISFLCDVDAGRHTCLSGPFRGIEMTADTIQTLKEGRDNVRELLHTQICPLMEDYLRRLDSDVKSDPTNEVLIDRNSRLACDLHSHKMLLYRNYHEFELSAEVAKTLIGSFVFLTTRHTWNKTMAPNAATGFAGGARISVPEVELYELLQVTRRRVISWLANCRQGVLDGVLQEALQLSSSLTGSFRPGTDVLDVQNRWSRIEGARSCGRWAVGSTRTISAPDGKEERGAGASALGGRPVPSAPVKLMRQVSFDKQVGEVSDNGMLGVEIDVQIGQMTLRSKHLQALNTEIANHPDVASRFGDTTIQASMLERAEHRQRYRLVGLNHEIEYWPTPHKICAPIGDQWERDYDPADLFDTEKWIVSLFEPVRKTFFDGPNPQSMQFLMQDRPLAEDAEMCILLGLHQQLGGPFKLVYLFRRLKCVHVYECVSQGREWWYSLHFTTDTRYTLRDMQPSSANRQFQYPDFWIRGAGSPYPLGVTDCLNNDIEGIASTPSASVLIIRDQNHQDNMSGGRETFVPRRLLFGMIPEALLEVYDFWQDESIVPKGTHPNDFIAASRGYKRLRGYPQDEDGEYMVTVEITTVGSWADFKPPDVGKNSGRVVQVTKFPGRTVTVTRRPYKKFQEEFKLRQRIASQLEVLHLLLPPSSKSDKKSGDESNSSVAKVEGGGDGKDRGNDKDAKFKIDSEVECDYEGKQEFWPCCVRRVNDDGTYDLEYVGSYKWVGMQRSVEADLIQPRGQQERKRHGEGIWHWEGMTESEEDDWRKDSDDEGANGDANDEEEEEKKKKKSRLSFMQFDYLDMVLRAADGSEELCIAAFNYLVNVKQIGPFTDMYELTQATTDAVAELKKHESLGSAAPGGGKKKKLNSLDEAATDDMVMLNLLYAPRRSRLHSILKVLTRIENASHIVAWTKAANIRKVDDGRTVNQESDLPGYMQFGCPTIDFIELPRLKLAFTARADHNKVLRLFSVDHVDLFISNICSVGNDDSSNNVDNISVASSMAAAKMIVGIEHSLMLSNVRDELHILVPVLRPKRPMIYSEPFSTFLVLDRASVEEKAERFFLYPVHISLSFMLTKGLNSALYLMLLRFLHRDYAEVFRLADSVATDRKFNEEGLSVLESFRAGQDDWHPDAHACRLKMSLVTIDGGMDHPWDLTTELSRYTVKLDSVSGCCRLSLTEELQLLESPLVATSTDSKAYIKEQHDEYTLALCFNRQQQLRGLLGTIASSTSSTTTSTDSSAPAGLTSSKQLLLTSGSGTDESKDGHSSSLVTIQCRAPPRSLTSNWPYYADNTVFGESYTKMTEITSNIAGESNTWPTEVLGCGGDVTDAPKGGWLVVAAFHTLWSAGCIKVMPSVAELVPLYQDMISFLSVRADGNSTLPISKEMKITQFPTFVVLRGGKEVARVEGQERAVEKLVRALGSHVTPDDKMSHSKHRHRLKIEASLAMGITEEEAQRIAAKEEEEASKKVALDWTWDPEQCGENYIIQNDGMSAVLTDESSYDKSVTWEYKFPYAERNSQWRSFSQEHTRKIEEAYKNGSLYGTGYAYVGNFYIESYSAVIGDYQVIGFGGNEEDGDYRDIEVRRVGDRCIVPNEESHLSAEQKEKDKRSAEWRDKMENYMRKIREQRVGRDIESMRGTIGFLPRTGTHRWMLQWDHEPSRAGRGDSVGVCADAREYFGAGPYPTLGGADGGASLALYADGNLFHNEKLLRNVKGCRLTPDGGQDTVAKKSENDAEIADEEKKETTEKKKENKKKFAKFSVGTKIEANYKGRGRFFKGSIKSVKDNGKYDINYDDGEKETNVLEDRIRFLNKEDADAADIKERENLDKESKEKASGLLKSKAPLFGKGSMVVCELDTDTDGGVLTFTVYPQWPPPPRAKMVAAVGTGDDTSKEEGNSAAGVTSTAGSPDQPIVESISGIYELLGGSEVFPCLSLAPMDQSVMNYLTELNKDILKRNNKRRAKLKKLGEGDEDGEEDENRDDDQEEEEEENDEEEEEEEESGDEDEDEDEGEEGKKVKKEDGEGGKDGEEQEEDDSEEAKEKKRLAKLKALEMEPFYVTDPTVTLKSNEEVEFIMKLLSSGETLAENQMMKKEEETTSSSTADGDNAQPSAAAIATAVGEGEQKIESSGDSDAPPPSKPEGGEGEEDTEDPDAAAAAAATEAAEAAVDPNDSSNESLDKIRWMFETEKSGWKLYTVEASRELERAARDSKAEYKVSVLSSLSPDDNMFGGGRYRGPGEEEQLVQHTVNLDSKNYTRDDGEGTYRVRRHVLSDDPIVSQWELLTTRYDKPMSCNGQGAIKLLQKVWMAGDGSGGVKDGETMSGDKVGLGFLFLYSLLSGDTRCRIVPSSSDWGGMGGGMMGPMPGFGSSSSGSGGGFSGYGGVMMMGSSGGKSSNTNDAHRFGLLLTQLYADRHVKSLPSSIINILGRNRQVSLRMPKFKDTRKSTQSPFINGWIDENEPKSPLADLYNKLTKMMTVMKKRGAFHFPPPPPHPELPQPATKATITKVSPRAKTATADISKDPGYVENMPTLSNYGCDNRVVTPLTLETVRSLAQDIEYRFAADTLRPQLPVLVEDYEHFISLLIKGCKATPTGVVMSSTLFVVDFFAHWCAPCKALAPVFRSLSLTTPTARFLSVDIDTCNEMVAMFGVTSMPTVLFMRLIDSTPLGDLKKSSTGIQVVGKVVGGGPQFLVDFQTQLDRNSTAREKETLKRFRAMCPPDAAEVEGILKNIAGTIDKISALGSQPLKECAGFVCSKTRSELGLPPISDKLAFDVSDHLSAQTAPAASVLERFRDDVEAHAVTSNKSMRLKMNHVADSDVAAFFRGEGPAKYVLMRGLMNVRELLKLLQRLRSEDEEMLADTVPMMEKAVNWVEGASTSTTMKALEEKDSVQKKNEKLRFILSRFSRRRSFVWPEFLFGALLSSCGAADLRRLNPFLSEERIELLLNMVSLSMLRANRLGLINRCIGSAIGLESLLVKILAVPVEQRAAKSAVFGPKLAQSAGDLAASITMGRHYMINTAASGGSTVALRYDPRYLVFEFVWNIQLRKKQVEIVNDFRDSLARGCSKVKQMIMGAGKTSVVAPLMALIVADGSSLVLSVVPKALVEMSRTRMRETFATIMVKRIYTLEFDRSTTVTPAMRRTLENATANRGVVVATPTTLKSIMLSYVEVLQNVNEFKAKGMRSKLPELQEQATELSKILSLFKEGIMLLDEVDLILHPLKSELNFPIGEKFDLDGAEEGERWNLPIHLLDAFFYASNGKTSSDTDRQGGQALDILKRISLAVQSGIDQRHLQRLPHITLLNHDFYDDVLKPLMAEWAYMWLLKNHLHGIERSEAIRYLLEGAAARSAASNKLKRLQLALSKAEVDVGTKSPMIRPTRGFMRTLSTSHAVGPTITEEDLELAAATTAIAATATLERQDSAASTTTSSSGPPTAGRRPSLSSTTPVMLSRAPSAGNEDSGLSRAEVEQLTEAIASATEHCDLMNRIYDLDEQLDEQTKAGGRVMAELTTQIVALQKQISDIECPRDDSLDNSVVVWCSAAFAPTMATSAMGGSAGAAAAAMQAGGDAAASGSSSGENSVPSICNRLEDIGLTVRRCSDPEEAVSRARDLQEEGHLRCIIIGGGERGMSCGPMCTAIHTRQSKCLVCSQEFRMHIGHNCRSGGRGSFLLSEVQSNRHTSASQADKLDAVQLMTTLTDEESAFARQRPEVGALPRARGIVYTAHMTMKEEVRMNFWKLGTSVTGEGEELVDWVQRLPPWNQDAAAAAAAAAAANEEEEDVAGAAGVGVTTAAEEEAAAAETKRQLAELKSELEMLEAKKAAAGDGEDSARRVLQTKAAEAHSLLEASVAKRVEVLHLAEQEMTNVFEEAKASVGDKEPAQQPQHATYSGPHSATEAALAMAWLHFYRENKASGSPLEIVPTPAYTNKKTQVEDTTASAASLSIRTASGAPPSFAARHTLASVGKYLQSIRNEISFLQQMSLAAKVVAHVTSPQHKKLLNLCHNWLSTFLPHCLAKVNRVTFGLLSAEDVEAALAVDPLVPRSRLKLAVPFLGKDVPSRASEFAHPDIIIGLTILAYRYSGLRRDDFTDIVDQLTTQFSQEIGPARGRESSIRHEKWVYEAGGAVRGLKTNTEGLAWRTTANQLSGASAQAVSSSSSVSSSHQLRSSSSSTTSGGLRSGSKVSKSVGDDKKETATSAVDEDEDAKREVVQLKFLQKSNVEQMDKLYDLINHEPMTIHHYLQRSVFPTYMRSQRMKISASGQSVGGDMLFGRRVGFSGTPSDLLPQELGRCDYETGDDGMMLTTCLDPNIASHEFLQDKWRVEDLLDRIATADDTGNRFSALIDTGALITGFSNKEVAQELLDRGLTWCDGVVFLDDEDRQQVLVRATGRVVSADQCGVSLERRFAFYDQIHTTGMDIKHVVNATAVITLGKDMVFRDYVQGAYRMRGIGAGQKVHIFIIPEVRQLMRRELATCGCGEAVWNPTGALQPDESTTSASTHVLEDVVAWLITNSLRSEQTQWTMLCLQNIGNLYRKNAFKNLHRSTQKFFEGISSATAAATSDAEQATAADTATAATSSSSSDADIELDTDEARIAALDPFKSIKVFDEPIDFSLEAGVPDPVPFEQKLRSLLEAHEGFLLPDQHAIGHSIMMVVGQFSMIQGSANRLDTEQEREQEQEQEKEVEARKDQQIEVEKFVDREFSRQEESQRPWPYSILSKPLPNWTSTSADNNAALSCPDHPFYRLCDFKLRHHDPVAFPEQLLVSSNFFNPAWAGLRRVKNVIMVMEYAHSTAPDKLRLRTADNVVENSSSKQILTAAQEAALAKAHTLLGFHAAAEGQPNRLNRQDLSNAVRAATDEVPSDELLDKLCAMCSSTKSKDHCNMSLEDFRALLLSEVLYQQHEGRYWVALSLAEAETLRCILHHEDMQTAKKKQTAKKAVAVAAASAIRGDKQLALRYSPMSAAGAPPAGDGGMVFDVSRGWQQGAMEESVYSHVTVNPVNTSTVIFGKADTGATPYEAAVAHNAFRFFDCDMFYPDAALNILVRVLRSNLRERDRFFHSTIACRRRMERKWQETPLAKVFTVADEWISLKQKAQAAFVVEALQARGITKWEAFTAFDADNNGVLSPAEFYGALRWLNVPDLTVDDVVDFIESADKNRDGLVDYREYMDMLKISGSSAEEESGSSSSSSSSAQATKEIEETGGVVEKEKERTILAKVEPFGADELREVMLHRRQAEQQRVREERLRKLAYKEALDLKVFEEELQTSKRRKGGANPNLTIVEIPTKHLVLESETALTGTDNTVVPLTCTDFKFFTNQQPLRCATTGKSHFVPMLLGTPSDKPIKPLRCKKSHDFSGFNYYWGTCMNCKKRETQWACWSCSVFCCSTCFEGDKRGKEADKRDPAKHSTFMRCANGCSFTLHLPADGVAPTLVKGGASPAGESKTVSATDSDSLSAAAVVASGSYTVMMQVRFEKLPPKGHLQSLLRFTLADTSTLAQTARKVHRTAVYLNGDGVVVSRPILAGGGVEYELPQVMVPEPVLAKKKEEEDAAAAKKAAEEEAAVTAAAADSETKAAETADDEKADSKMPDDVNAASIATSLVEAVPNVAGNENKNDEEQDKAADKKDEDEDEDGSDKEEEEKDEATIAAEKAATEAAEMASKALEALTKETEKIERLKKKNEALKAKPSTRGRIRPKSWHTLMVCVHPDAGTLTVYIDGELCHTAANLDPSDLRLHHKMVMLGGGKQAHVRGGDIHRAAVYTGALNGEGVKALSLQLQGANPAVGGFVPKAQACFRGYMHRKKESAAREAAEKAKQAEIDQMREQANKERRERDLQEKKAMDAKDHAAAGK